MTITPTITMEMLRDLGPEQQEILRAEWPNGMEATLENVLRAQEIGLRLDLAGGQWLTPEARNAYREAELAAWKAYYEAVGSASKAYDEAASLADEIHNVAMALARKVRDETRAKALIAGFLASQNSEAAQ